jgi:predicted enzyme related to lactoylglutathione lyase
MYKGANVTLMVKDFDAAFAFYSEALGFDVKTRSGNEWAELAAPGLNLALHPAHGQELTHGGATTLGLQVDDIRTTYDELKSRGVQFGGPVMDTGHLLLANFADPEGNPLYLMQMTEPAR